MWCQSGFGAVPLNSRSNESAALVNAAKVVGARRRLALRWIPTRWADFEEGAGTAPFVQRIHWPERWGIRQATDCIV